MSGTHFAIWAGRAEISNSTDSLIVFRLSDDIGCVYEDLEIENDAFVIMAEIRTTSGKTARPWMDEATA